MVNALAGCATWCALRRPFSKGPLCPHLPLVRIETARSRLGRRERQRPQRFLCGTVTLVPDDGVLAVAREFPHNLFLSNTRRPGFQPRIWFVQAIYDVFV